jgi:hypothetical protein
MRVLEVIFAIWAILVFLWWVIMEPESAPQQSALAGQALVLLAAPYVIIATLQRSHARERFEAKTLEQRKTEADQIATDS